MTQVVKLPSAYDPKPAKVVWKYRIPLAFEPVEIAVPNGARFLAADLLAVDGWTPNIWELWYEVNGKQATQNRHVFQSYGTGDIAIPRCAEHKATGVVAQKSPLKGMAVDRFVWHLYEYPSGTEVIDDGR